MNTRKYTIGFTYDAKADYKLLPCDAPDKYDEFDSEKTLSEIAGALASQGHAVARIGHVKSLLERLMNGERWDIVFNIAEGVSGRNRESQVPAILELFGIPYTGSDALTMGLTLDKAVAKMVVAHAGIMTPKFMEVKDSRELSSFNLKFPAIVKPSEEGTSKGISEESVVRSAAQLKARVEWVIDTYRQPALVEEFIIGQEFTVAVIGNENPEALSPVQIKIKGKADLGEDIYTHACVTNTDIDYVCPADIPAELDKKLREMAAGAFTALGCRDLGRFDVRVDRGGTPYFLECNPLPSLGLIDVFPLVAEAEGMTYNEIISKILNYGIERNKVARLRK